MPSSSLRRRDPFWNADGVAARRLRRRRRFVATIAFFLALGAVAGAALGWAAELGVNIGLGLPLDRFRLP